MQFICEQQESELNPGGLRFNSKLHGSNLTAVGSLFVRFDAEFVEQLDQLLAQGDDGGVVHWTPRDMNQLMRTSLENSDFGCAPSTANAEARAIPMSHTIARVHLDLSL